MALVKSRYWLVVAVLAAAVGGQEQTKAIRLKSEAWEVTRVAAAIVKSGAFGKPAAPMQERMLEIEISSEYIGPEAELTPPTVAVVGASGAEYKPLKGYTAVNAESMGSVAGHFGWLMSAADDIPIAKRLSRGTSLPGVIYYVAVPDREPGATLKLRFADVKPFPLNAK